MPIGLFSEGNTRYILEARESDGACCYRKYCSEDRWNYMFGLIPESECGVAFRSRHIATDADKRLPIVARHKVCTYISREFQKLMGIDPIPERRINRQIRARHGRPGAVQQTGDDRKLLPPQYLTYVDPETLPGQLRPSVNSLELSEEERSEMLTASNFPSSERPPDDFDMEAWKGGKNFETPEDLLLSKPQEPDLVPMAAASAEGGAKGFSDQLVEFGERDESRSERQQREHGGE